MIDAITALNRRIEGYQRFVSGLRSLAPISCGTAPRCWKI